MNSSKHVEILRYITVLPLVIVLLAMVMEVQPSAESEIAYLSIDANEAINKAESAQVN